MGTKDREEYDRQIRASPERPYSPGTGDLMGLMMGGPR